MKKFFLLIIIASFGLTTGCSTAKPGLQFGLRGYPNAPHQRIAPLVVDQNAMYRMNAAQFAEYQKRLNWAVKYHREVIRNDQAAANAAKAWVNDPGNYYNSSGGIGRVTNSAMNSFSSGLSSIISRAMSELANKIKF